jgi:ATP-dependent 26S proteasome regulatory subunit
MNNKNIILVIEDAEKALLSREENHENSSVVSAILNLTDSFISSALNISIVATFNTAKENIDKALLRKGRLKYCHEFKKLSVYDAQVLTNSLNFQYKVSEPMTLAEVYNIYESSGYSAPKEKIISGFGCV